MSASQQGFAQAEMLTSDSRRLERAEVLTCLSRPLHRLLREPVQRPDGELEVLFRRVLVFGVAEAPQTLDEEHYRGHQARHLRGVVQGPARQPVRLTGHLVYGLFGEGDQVLVEGDGLYAPQALPFYGDALLVRDAGRRFFCGVEHARQHGRVEGALVEDISQKPLNAVTIAGLTLTNPVVARTSSRAAASSLKASAERAAAMKASLLTSIGVEPEWACWPIKRTA